ncbi:MAG: DNA polymerase III subunit delta' [Candidatus Competibacterales bacterium]|nr:DNA polymerase III subunit delta' [Candidatus Competibacterales bacterium]
MELGEFPLPWQRPLWARLQEQASTDRLPHALLLCGPEGLGKRGFADRLAQMLLCRSPVGDGPETRRPCDSCRDCEPYRAGAHPDRIRIAPEAPDKPLRVEPIRELTGFLTRTGRSERGKVALIEAAERMNVNAANALLKSLEEPPPGSLLLLISVCPEQLPATVRSRCQRLPFFPPPRTDALPWLRQHLDEESAAEVLLELARGRPLAALDLASSGGLEERQARFAEFRALLAGELAPAEFAARWSGPDTARWLDWLLGWQQDMIRLKMCPGVRSHLSHPDLAAELAEEAERHPAWMHFRRLDELDGLRGLVGTSINQVLQLEVFAAGLMTGPDSTTTQGSFR